MNLDFLGRGWSFPPEFDKSLPGVAMLEHEADIVASLQTLLSTCQGERAMFPQYGCNLDDLIFESLDTGTKALMADKIETAILYHEPRIELEGINLDDTRELEGVILIEVVYRVKTTNSRFNFVFPYYRLEGTDLDLGVTVNLLPDND